jgi:hypothetical protein
VINHRIRIEVHVIDARHRPMSRILELRLCT